MSGFAEFSKMYTKAFEEAEARYPAALAASRQALLERDLAKGHRVPEEKPEQKEQAKQIPNLNYTVCPDGVIYRSLPGYDAYPAKQEKQKHGYIVKIIHDNERRSYGYYRKSTPAARLVAEAFIPNPSGKMHVRFKNCDRYDHSVENLEWY